MKPATASAETIFGGHLLGVKGSDEAVLFYDWEGTFVRKIDVEATDVYWSEAGDLCLLACEDTAYVRPSDAKRARRRARAAQRPTTTRKRRSLGPCPVASALLSQDRAESLA